MSSTPNAVLPLSSGADAFAPEQKNITLYKQGCLFCIVQQPNNTCSLSEIIKKQITYWQNS